MAYPDSVKARAANLHIYADYSYDTLTGMPEMPDTKSTLSDWASKGEGTGGTPWSEVKELIQEERGAIEKKNEIDDKLATMQDVSDNIGPLLIEAAKDLRRQLRKQGDSNPTYTKYADILDKITQVAQQQHVSEIHDRLEKLAAAIGSIIGREVQNDTVARRLQTEIQQEFNTAYEDIDDLLGIS